MDEIYQLYVDHKNASRESLLRVSELSSSHATINKHVQPMSQTDFERYWSLITEENREQHLSQWRGEPQPPSELAAFLMKSITEQVANNESHPTRT